MSREVRFFLVGERISSLFIEEKNFLFSCFCDPDDRSATLVSFKFYSDEQYKMMPQICKANMPD